MKKIFHLLSILLLSLLFSCDKAEQNGGAEHTNIASISQQIEEIKESLPKLRATLKSLKNLEADMENGSGTTKAGESDGSIKGLKQYIQMLEKRIEALEEYVYSDSEATEGWLEMTYATLEMYEETINILATLQSELETLKVKVEGLDEKLCQEVESSIKESVTSMKDWVNELLTGYYDIAAVDAKFAAIEQALSSEDEELRKEVSDTRKELRESLADMEKAYKNAIQEAIEKNNGVIEGKIAKAVADINSRIDKERSDINKRLDDIEDRLSKLEDTVADLLKRIQSITYLPMYPDNLARVNFPYEDTNGSTVALDFIISPSNTVEGLVKSYQKALSIKATQTGSTDFIDLPIMSCSCDPVNGILTIVASCDALSMDFYHGNIEMRAMLYISDGNNNRISEQILLTQSYSKIPNNQIWYSVSGKTPIDIKTPNGTPKLISNQYDASKDCYVATFDSVITQIPVTYFSGAKELTSITLPNSTIYIEDHAFNRCTELIYIDLGNSLTNISALAFLDCNKLKEFRGDLAADNGKCVIVGNTLVAAARASINGEYVIPENVSVIGKFAFSYCHGMTGIFIHDDIEVIEESAFNGCHNLKHVKANDLSAWCQIDFLNQTSNPLYLGGELVIDEEVLTDITFPNDLNRIKPRAFCGYSHLKTFTCHENVYEIDDEAFYNSGVNRLTLQSINPPSMGTRIFRYDDSGPEIAITADLNTIEAYWSSPKFKNYRHLLSVNIEEIPESHIVAYKLDSEQALDIQYDDRIIYHKYTGSELGCIVIYKDAITTFEGFRNTTGIERIKSCKLPSQITSIGQNAFQGWERLYDIILPDNIVSIGDFAFDGCKGLKGITLPKSLTSIGNNTFRRCGRLTEIDLPESITTIGDYAFSECGQLAEINLPESITTIGDYVFYECDQLAKIGLPEGITTTGDYTFWGCDQLAEINLPEGITTIGDYVFYECGQLAEINLPEGITTIGDYAFGECKSLREIILPQSLTIIGEFVFYGCDNLSLIIVKSPTPPHLEDAGVRYGYDGEILIPDESVEEYLRSNWIKHFSSMSKDIKKAAEEYLHWIKYKTNDNQPVSFNIVRLRSEYQSNVIMNEFDGAEGIVMMDIFQDELVSGIDWNIFDNPSNMTDIEFSAGIGYTNRCFDDCPNLKSIIFHDGLTKVVNYAFENCSSLETIILPEGVKSIGAYAFNGCSSLKEIKLPNSMGDDAYIGEYAFCGCSSLTEIDIPNGIDTIRDFLFSGCSSLSEILLPESITQINSRAFEGCSSLTELILPESIITLGESLFANCTNLKSIIIPESASDLWSVPLLESNILEVYIKSKTPIFNLICLATTWNWEMLVPSFPTVYVPMESLEVYKETWSQELSAEFSELSDKIIGYNYND